MMILALVLTLAMDILLEVTPVILLKRETTYTYETISAATRVAAPAASRSFLVTVMFEPKVLPEE